MNRNQELAAQFIGRLTQNPGLGALIPLQKEEQLLQFLQINAQKLYPTLSSDDYFPNMHWKQIFTLLIRTLFQEVNKELNPFVEQAVANLDFTFIRFLRKQNTKKVQLQRFIQDKTIELSTQPQSRRFMTGPLVALKSGKIEKYIDIIFDKHKYTHFELTKVQRLRMGPREVSEFIKVILLLRASVFSYRKDLHIVVKDNGLGQIQGSIGDRFYSKMAGDASLFPEQVMRSCLNSYLSFSENRFIEASARLAAIFNARYRHFKPNQKVDRGAESPDKSWFNIAKKNYKYYGFDVDMLSELYSIAAEKRW